MVHFKELFGPQIQDFLKDEAWPQMKSFVKECIIDRVADFAQSLFQATIDNTHAVESERLDKESLIHIAKKYIVEGCDGIAAIKTQNKKEYIIYLAYMSGKELLPVENNNYIIIKTLSLTPDLEGLFGNEKCIILN